MEICAIKLKQYYNVACTAVATQRPRDKANKQRTFLGNGSVNTFSRQRTVFSMWSMQRNYNQDSYSLVVRLSSAREVEKRWRNN
jgi:hypothetical protein